VIGMLGVIFLVTVCPLTCNVVAFLTNAPQLQTDGQGPLKGLPGAAKAAGGWLELGKEALAFPGPGTWQAVSFLLGFNALALVLFVALPGEKKSGPVTSRGHTPWYTDNAVANCFVFATIFIGCSNGLGPYSLGLFDLGVMYDAFPGMVGALNIFGLLFCAFLYVKGLTYPSCPDSGSSGNGMLFDYYWGTDLYPRIFGIDVKQFVNCRFSMMFWQLAGVSFAYRSYTMHGAWDPAIVFCALSQYLYLVKFFIWEIGYMRSIDIIVDRAGFYETWGCLVWVPSVYTLHTRVLVRSPSTCSFAQSFSIFAIGLLGVALNFWADTQRQHFREAKGKCKIWGKPAASIEAKYNVLNEQTGKKEAKTTQLLASGWWGVARHSQYLFELMAAWSWGFLGAGGILCPNGPLPLFYPAFLTILLVHRERRDHEKCAAKYGKAWDKYCELVPYRILPLIY